jgi:hypothetical protein
MFSMMFYKRYIVDGIQMDSASNGQRRILTLPKTILTTGYRTTLPET